MVVIKIIWLKWLLIVIIGLEEKFVLGGGNIGLMACFLGLVGIILKGLLVIGIIFVRVFVFIWVESCGVRLKGLVCVKVFLVISIDSRLISRKWVDMWSILFIVFIKVVY